VLKVTHLNLLVVKASKFKKKLHDQRSIIVKHKISWLVLFVAESY